MTASTLLDQLTERGIAHPLGPRPGATRAIVVGTIEIAECQRASDTFMRARWRQRVGGSPARYLLIADDPQHANRVRVLGPARGDSPIRSVDSQLLVAPLEEAATLPALEAVRRIADDLTRICGDGLSVNGLLTHHTLEHRFRGNAAWWESATGDVRAIKQGDSWQNVLRKLGYVLQQLPRRGYLARHESKPVVLIHPKAKARDLARVDSQGRPPEGLLISDCEAQGAEYGILVQGGRFRLFDARSASPASEWLELDIRLLRKDRLPFLALLGPSFLGDGRFAALRNEAQSFGVALHRRLDQTIRQDALPALAVGMQSWAREHGIDLRNDRERQELERAALTLVFRIVFILFCESAGHLPMGNRTYGKVSLSSLVREAYETTEKLSPASASLWSGFVRLVKAMRNGNPAWGVPAYNGALFAPRGFDGVELLERLELRDPVFAKVLVAIGQDQKTRRGADFSTLEIAHIGHTYESLLSLRLSLAKKSVRYDRKRDRYVQARKPGDAEVRAGGLLWQTYQGGRKAGGVYYTPVDIVRHLVKRAVLPAYERHLVEVANIARTEPDRAARHLLSFAVVDPACGSAHFLVQVAETLAERTVMFLSDHPLPAIVKAMDRLRQPDSLGLETDDMALLRRLLVKNCVFGVDVSPMGAEVATLSLWLASFVPGLSLSYLGRNVRVGDSLIGVTDYATVVDQDSLFADQAREHLEKATEIDRTLARIEDRTPEEVSASLKADRDAKLETARLRRLFDLWTAEQFGLSDAREHVALHIGDVLTGGEKDTKGLGTRAQKLAARHGFLHWPLAFPQVFFRDRPGFDVVVGNPPWEEVTIEELSFYGMYRPGINSLPDVERSRVIAALVHERPELPGLLKERQKALAVARAALASGDYSGTSGDPDLYKYFCQRYRSLVREKGFIGVVLPRTAFINDGSKQFREWMYLRCATHRIDFLLNRGKWIFDSEERYSVALVAAERAIPDEGHRVEVAGDAKSASQWQRQASEAGIRVAIRAFGANWETPLLRSQQEADLLGRLRLDSRFPYGCGGRWSCFASTDLHESQDKDFWRDNSEGVPFWKGESFDQYDPKGSHQRWCRATPELKAKVRKSGTRTRPGQGSVHATTTHVTLRRKAVQEEIGRARLAFRDQTNRTNSRTILACMIPPGVLLNNKAPYLAFLDGDPASQAACLAVMNSLPFDWQARRYIEMNVNFFLLEGLYLPDLDDAAFNAISRAAARLSAADDRFADFAAAPGVEYGPLSSVDKTRLRIEYRRPRRPRVESDEVGS